MKIESLSNKMMLMGVGALALALAAVVAVSPEMAQAGTGGQEFAALWTTLTDWIQGLLGRVIAGAIVVVGIVMGVARQSLMAFAIGIGGGMGLYNAPLVIDQIMATTLENAPALTEGVITISNGLM